MQRPVSTPKVIAQVWGNIQAGIDKALAATRRLEAAMKKIRKAK